MSKELKIDLQHSGLVLPATNSFDDGVWILWNIWKLNVNVEDQSNGLCVLYIIEINQL